MNNEKYQDYTFQVGTFEGVPIMETITAQEFEDAAGAGITEDELINLTIETSCDWQRDC